MLQYLDMMMCIASIMLILAKTKEALVKKKELWAWLKQEYPAIYKKLRFSVFGIFMNLPGAVGRKISVLGYKIANKVFGFN